MKRDKLVTIIICCVFVLFAGFFYFNSGTSSVVNNSSVITKKESSSVKHTTQQTPATEEIAVYICGAVKNPGVYKFTAASRVCDAVRAAGGFKKNADKISINQAEYLKDGEQITIPVKHHLKSDSSKDNQSYNDDNTKASSNLININQATENELMTLSGVGQSKASSIIDYRNKHGNFTKIEDIMKVAGIKKGVFNKIKDKITI